MTMRRPESEKAAPKPMRSLKSQALRLLSQREYSGAELVRKLQGHASSPDEVVRTVQEMRDRGWVDDRRVADSLVHQKSRRWGTQRVLQEMQRKGLDAELIEDVSQSLYPTELERARAVWQQKYGVAPEDLSHKLRQMRFLAGRGFSQESIRQVLKEAVAQAADPEQ